MKKYYELYKKIKENIANGVYKENQKLPSKRNMSDKEGVSLITVEKAYNMLCDEGYITSYQRKGYFVNKVLRIVNEGNNKISYLELPKKISNRNFEYSNWFKTIRKVISDNREELFIKAPNKGCEVLRNAISDYLLRYRGMFANPSRIIVGSGAEQLYETVVKILGRDKIYGIENPSYHRISSTYKIMGAEICLLKLGKDGIEKKEINKKFDVLHVTPFHSYPSGVSTSIVKRQEYIKWANESGNYIVEDDFDSELYLPGKPIETMYSLNNGKNIIYINTFSKSLSPSMRIGYMILPENLLEKYETLLGEFSCSVPVMDQYILAEFINNGSFERHINKMRRKLI